MDANELVVHPEDIVALAKSLGYEERRPKVSCTLFFVAENQPEDPILIDVYYTTRTVKTLLKHPKQGFSQLFRSDAYSSLSELREIMVNPRIHTGKGYRKAAGAGRECIACGLLKLRGEFTQNQWRKGPDVNRCKECVKNRNHTDVGIIEFEGGGSVYDDASDPAGPLSELNLENLRIHDRKMGSIQRQDLVRCQFNCPVCPTQGRGQFIFFKKVPAMKPVVKCPRCKAAKRGSKDCARLYPVLKGAEKGYGMFKCGKCGKKWGSTRAQSNVGQECHGCKEKGEDGVLEVPFRIEAYKARKKRFMKRVPKYPISEGKQEEPVYDEADKIRHRTGGGFALQPGSREVKGGGVVNSDGSSTGSSSFEIVPRDDLSTESGNILVGSLFKSSASCSVYKHFCAGCATGSCKSRKVPQSEIHDRTGSTASTSSSIMTNSSVDKADFPDRDADFVEE